MTQQFFAQSLQFLVLSLLALWCLNKIKALFISSTCTFKREIEADGEFATFGVNFYLFEPKSWKYKKYQELVEVAEQRKKFVFERFDRIIKEEQERKKHLSVAKGG